MDNKKVENKKHMSNKKKFWVGMSALAAVGAITATVAYFQTNHGFANSYISPNYSVTVKQVFDQAEASDAFPGKTIDTNISVENNGSAPVLARITYVAGSSDGGEISWRDGETGMDLENNLAKGWTAGFNTGTKFERDTTDGSYYYVGVLDEKEIAAHLKSLTLEKNAYDGNNTSESNIYFTGTEWKGELGDGETQKGSGKTFDAGTNPMYIKAVVETVQATGIDGKRLTDKDITNLATAKEKWQAIKSAT